MSEIWNEPIQMDVDGEATQGLHPERIMLSVVAIFLITAVVVMIAATGLAAADTEPTLSDDDLWNYSAEDSQGITAPVYDDGIIFFTEANHVEAVDAETGEQLWRHELFLGEFSPAPAAADGMVYVVGDDGNATAFDAETGDEEWVYEAGYQIRSPPRVVDGTLYFGTNWEDSTVYAVDAETGEEEWTHGGPSSDIRPIEVVDGTVYVGSYDLNLYAELYAIDADSGWTEWVFDIENAEISLIDLDDDTVYTTDGTVVYAIDADSGEAEWETEIEDGARQVVHDDGTLYFSYDGEVLALDVDTQEKLWRVDVDPTDFKRVSPVEPDGDSIYVGSEGEEAVHQLDAESGEELSKFDAAWEVSEKPTLVDDVLYVMTRDGVLHAIAVGNGDTDEATFSVDSITPENAEVTQGADSMDFVVTVENTGDVDGEQEIVFEVDNSSVYDDEKTVTLETGESADVEFEDVPVGDFEVGEYTTAAVSENDTATGTLVVEEEPEPGDFASFEVQPVDDPLVQGEPLELEFVNATDIDGEPYTTGDDSLTNIDIENPLDDDPRRVALEFEDGDALATFELLDENETDSLDLEDYSGLEAWDIDDPSVNDTYSVEIVASRLASFEVQPVDDPIVQGEPLELEFVNATDIDGEPYTTGDDSLTNIDIENPLDDDPRRVALEFEDGDALAMFELLDEDETENLDLQEYSGLKAWDIDDPSVNDTYSVEIVASRLASFEVQPVDDPVVQGEPLELEFVNATDIDGGPFTTDSSPLTNIDVENPLDDDPRRVALEFEDGEALATFELLDEDETADLDLEDFSELEAWDIDDPSINDTYSVEIVASRLASFEVQPVDDPLVQGESLELEFVNATDIDGEPYTTGDDSLTNLDVENPLDEDPRRVALEFEDGEARSTFELLDENETDSLDLEDYSGLEAWDIDDESINDTYSVEIVASRLASFEVQPVDDPLVQGEPLELEFVNATDIDGEPYTTGDDSLTNVDVENPLDDDPRRVALEFEDGEARSTFELLDEDETDSLGLEKFSGLEAWNIDDPSVNDTYSVEIVASRLASFEVQPVDDTVVQGEPLELEFVNATDIDEEPYTTGDDSLTNVDVENPLDDDPRRVALEFEDGEALSTFELLDENETDSLSVEEFSELEAWDIDDPAVNDTYSVEIAASRLASFEVQPVDDPVVQGEPLELEFVNATDINGESYTTGDDSFTNIDVENPQDDEPRRVALEFEDGEALATFELLDEDETENLSLGETSGLEAWDIDDPSVNDTYSVEIVASRLASFEVQPVDDPVVQGEPLELEFVNATDIDGELYTTGDDSLTNIDIENPLDDDPRRVALEFEDGGALATFELLDEDETDGLDLEEYSGLKAWDIDDLSINNTYSVEIVASRLASFDIQPVNDTVVQGETLELEFVNATDIDGEPYTTGDDSLTNIDVENPLDDDPRRVALEFEDGEALSTFELLDEDETNDLSLGEVLGLKAWDIDDHSINNTYSVDIVASRLASFDVMPIEYLVVQGEPLELEFVNATDIDGEPYTTGGDSLTNIDVENPLDDDPRRVALEFEDGEALSTLELLDEDETEDLGGGEYTDLRAWMVDDGSVEDTYGVEVLPEDSAAMEVTQTWINATDIEEDEWVAVEATVENVGNDTGDHEVVFEIDGTPEAAETVSLDSAENETVAFDHQFDQAGEYDVTVDGETVATVSVEADVEDDPSPSPPPAPSTSPDISVTNVTIDSERVDVGDTVSLEVVLTNEGDGDGSETVAVRLDGEELATTSVNLEGGETATVDVEVDPGNLEAGLYELQLVDEDGTALSVVDFEFEDNEADDDEDDVVADDEADDDEDDVVADDEADDDEDDGVADDEVDDDEDDGVADDEADDDEIPGFGIVIAVVSILGLCVLGARRPSA